MSHASVLVRLNFDKCWLQSKQGESARRGCAHQRAGGCDRSGVTILRPDARSPGGVNAAGEVSPGGVMKAAAGRGATYSEQLCHLGPNAVSQVATGAGFCS